MRVLELLQHIWQRLAQPSQTKQTPADYHQDCGPLTSEQIEQIKQSVRTKYA
jgi:hypothetical protein